ncbi:MAG TPA: DoxX family protein [Cellvibrionales bacterium]|nr:DoxX family protein [Cellvibrionales bacterium]|tara:strand:+ start:296 stop:682 length:387 start_codon:yes stop_codon:yes gene_type:complete
MKFLDPINKHSLLLLRVMAGLMFSFHGVQKLFGILSQYPAPAFGSQLWFGGLIELGCGLLIAVGLFSRPAAFLASGTMAVAYIQFHWKFQFSEAFFPAINHGEAALLYCLIFFYLACRPDEEIHQDIA